jgi:hypothetical protein
MTQIFKNYEEFSARSDKSVNGVSEEFANLHPNWDEQNLTNKSCWNCRNCKNCENCIECISCENCIECSECANWSWSNTFKVQMTCFN